MHIAAPTPTPTTTSADPDTSPTLKVPNTSPAGVDPTTVAGDPPTESPAAGDPNTTLKDPAILSTVEDPAPGSTTQTSPGVSEDSPAASDTPTPAADPAQSWKPEKTDSVQGNQPGTVISPDPSNTAIVSSSPTSAAGGVASPGISAAPSYMIGSQSLVPGGPAITVSGTVLSLPSGGSSIVIGGSTQDAGTFFSSEARPEYIVGTSQTLKESASAIVVSGTKVSLVSG